MPINNNMMPPCFPSEGQRFFCPYKAGGGELLDVLEGESV